MDSVIANSQNTQISIDCEYYWTTSLLIVILWRLQGNTGGSHVSNVLGVENWYRADKQDLYSNEDYWRWIDIANILLQFSQPLAAVNIKKYVFKPESVTRMCLPVESWTNTCCKSLYSSTLSWLSAPDRFKLHLACSGSRLSLNISLFPLNNAG